MRKLKIILASALCVASLIVAQAALAQSAADDIGQQLGAAGTSAGVPDPIDPRFTVALIIRSLLGLLGTIIFCYYLYAGFLWTTAGGNDEQVSKAKTTIKNATIGLILVLMSYTITLAASDIAHGWRLGSSSGLFGWIRGLLGG